MKVKKESIFFITFADLPKTISLHLNFFIRFIVSMSLTKRILFFAFIFFFFTIGMATAQKGENEASYIVNTQDFTTEDGLSHRRVRSFTQDVYGFIWMGTPYGLNRYDGYEFKVYMPKNVGLQGNNISRVISTPDSMVWLLYSRDIKGWNAIDVFDPVRGVPTPIEDYFKEELPFDVDKLDFLEFEENKDGSIWFSAEDRLFEYDGTEFKLIIDLADSLEITGFVKTNAGGNKGLGWLEVHYEHSRKVFYLCFDENGNIIDRTKVYEHENDLYASRILEVLEDGTMLFFINEKSKRDGIPRAYQKKLNTPEELFIYSTNKNYRHQRFVPYRKHIWCSGDTGPVDVFDEKGQFIYQIKENPQFTVSAHASFFDNKGGYWLSHKSTVSLTYSNPNPFKQYIHNNKKLGNVGCRGIGEDKNGRLYINGHRGSFYLNDKKKEKDIVSFPIPRKFYRTVHLDTALRVALMVEEEDNSVWLTDQFHRLLHYFPTENRIEFFVHENVPEAEQFKKRTISMNWSLFKDFKGKIWIGQNRGISYLDTISGLLKKQEDYGKFDLLIESEVFYFYENAQGIWLATTTGLYLADKEMNILERFSPEGDAEHYLPHGIIAHVYEDKEGVFWLASKGGGLIQWNPKTKDYQQFTRENGLSHDVVYAVYGDDYNHLWMSSDMGIMRMNKSNNSFKNYLPKNGITHEEFNTASHYKAKDGTLYFGSLNGVTAFHPKDFLEKKEGIAEQVRVSSFTKYSNTENNQEVELTINPILYHRVSIFSSDRTAVLRFSVLDFQQLKTVIYGYKIEGLDREWSYTSNPELNLVGLPVGEYRLHIKTQDENVEPLILRLDIHPPIYLRFWFILLIIGIVVVLIYGYIISRERKLRKQKEKLELEVKARTHKIEQQTKDLKALDKLKSKFFANISHELRTPLTLILGPLSMLIKKEKYKEDSSHLLTIQRNGKYLSQIVEQILDLSKLEANKVEVKEESINLNTFVRIIYAAFDSQATFQKVDYQLDYVLDEDLHILLDRDKVGKILNNFLSNAFKFTRADGEIVLRVGQLNNQLRFDVVDTGKGIHANDLPHVFERFYQTKQNVIAEGGTGIGLAFCKELAELMGGKLLLESTLGVGSTFSFLVDLKVAEVEKVAISEDLEENLFLEAEEVPSLESTPNTPKLFTVMLVEDNRDMQNYMKGLLEDAYTIITCNNGQIALDYLQDEKNALPNLIVSDVMMPEMDGFTLLKHCKEAVRLRSIPMIMLTARSATQDKLNALTIGVDDYLTKPFLVDELLVRIKNLLRNVQQRSIVELEEKAGEESELVDVAELVLEEEAAPVAQVSENDLHWIKDLEAIALEEADDPDFGVEELAQKIGMSRRNLQRRLKSITGLSPGQYLKEIRLQMARDLLERGVYQTIAEVAYATGFTTPYYFSQIYEKRFGKKVSAYFYSN
jgi:signal transduction histidine kinase/DNA-binding response OmpR family regulator/ligand-binding sensor domain-containing protein